MTERALPQAFSIYDEDFRKMKRITDALYPGDSKGKMSEVARRLIRAARVVDGKLVADEREPQEA